MDRGRSLTSIIMGDPRPDRLELSAKIRARVGRALPEDQPPPEAVVAVLETLADAPLTITEIAKEIGLSRCVAGDRAILARKLGLIDRTPHRPFRHFLTPEGEAVLG